jgi:hypothetical protein
MRWCQGHIRAIYRKRLKRFNLIAGDIALSDVRYTHSFFDAFYRRADFQRRKKLPAISKKLAAIDRSRRCIARVIARYIAESFLKKLSTFFRRRKQAPEKSRRYRSVYSRHKARVVAASLSRY